MPEVTNADDVELVIQRTNESGQVVNGAGTSNATAARIIVDDFTLTREEDNSLVSGVGQRLSSITRGDITYNFSFTMMGHDNELFQTVSTDNGESQIIEITARKTDDDGNVQFEYALPECIATSEEVSLSTGDAMEYSVEGIATKMERIAST